MSDIKGGGMEERSLEKMSFIRADQSFVEFKKDEIEQSVPRRFEEQVGNYPQKVAVRSEHAELTYEELNKFANRVAHRLIAESGAEPEPVALLLEDGPSAIGAVLGILKARKIYMAIDPSNPTALIEGTLDDAQANVIITDNKNLALSIAVAADRRRVLNIDAVKPSADAGDRPGVSVSPNDFAYIFYTSGSTGRPKGVVDNHRNVLHNIMRYTNRLKIAPEDRLTLLQSCSFSGSVSSLFCALLNGATSYPFSLKKEGAQRMALWLRNEKITIYHSVPSIFRLIATGGSNYPALRIIRLEGDSSSPQDIDLYKKHFSDSCILVNGLGATECGIVRQFFVTKSTPTPDSAVPIGYGVEDMRVFLLDEAGQEVEPGSIGEIAVESQFLAHGYWRRPDLTAAAFLAHPHDENRRIYRTGDLGRFQPDGCLDYLGRKNFQMKIRGQWVETAVVAKALLEFGYFKEAEVFMPVDNFSKPILVAYLVPKETPAPAISVIRRFLAERLPAHMVPTSYIFLERLPLNANGKIDRRALPPPSHARPDTGHAFIPPKNMLEDLLKAIWEEVIGIRPIGIHDSFFDLGADSLHALIMLTMVEKETEINIPPEALHIAPTIKALADYIQNKVSDQRFPLIEIQKGGRRRAFYFLHGDFKTGGLYCRRIAQHLKYDQPFYALPPCGSNGYPVLGSYQAMAAVHVKELRAHQPQGPYMLGGNCNGGLVAYEMARQLIADGQKVDLLVLIAATASNLRFRILKRLLSPFWFWLPNREKYEKRFFGLLQHIWYILIRLANVPIVNHPHFLWSQRTRILEELRTILNNLHRESPGRGLEMAQVNRMRPDHFNQALITKMYRRIDHEYMPGNYPGKVTLFWTNEEIESPAAAARWWRKIAREVELHILPGIQHAESLTVHAEAVAKILTACMEAAEIRSQPL